MATLTNDQKKKALQALTNIKNQWLIKWSMTTAQQWAEEKSQQSFLSSLDEKQTDTYNKMIDMWISPKETKQAIQTAIKDKKTESIFSTAENVWKAVAAMWAAKLWWTALDKLWRWIYGLTIQPTTPEAEATQTRKASNSWLSRNFGKAKNTKPETAVDTAYNNGIVWTKQRIWTVAERKANNIFKKTINPIMKKADDMWIKLKYSDLVQNAKDYVKNSVKYSESQKKTILENIDDLAKDLKWTTTLRNLDLEKQAIASKIPQKYWNMPKESKELAAAQKALAKSFRDGVHNTIKSKFNVNSAELYKNYANLKNVSKIWPKAATQWGLKWWFGNFVTTAVQNTATPVTTRVWKAVGKTWKLLQKPRDALTKVAKTVWKWAKNTAKAIWKWAWKLIKNGSVFAIVQDWTIIPWSPTNIAERARLTTAQYKKDENSVYQSANNPIWWTATIWDKWEVDKAVRKANNGASEWQFYDQFWWLHMLKDWVIYDIY